MNPVHGIQFPKVLDTQEVPMPFAGVSAVDEKTRFIAGYLAQLSRLSASWVQLGIDPIRASHNRTVATSGSTGRSRIEQQDLLRDEMAAMKVQFEAFKTQFE